MADEVDVEARRPIERLPIRRDELDRRRLRYRQQYRSGLVGGHLTRRRGQSLEFRELLPYAPGDDIRHVDWRATARYGIDDSQKWLVRRFVAEEQLTLAISVDLRDTVCAGPPAVSKAQVALWLAEALAWMTLRSNDEAILHSLFTGRRRPPVQLRGAQAAAHVRPLLAAMYDAAMPREAGRGWPLRRQPTAAEPATLNLDALWPYLPPTAVWLILTDGYLPPAAMAPLVRRLREAQDGLRWVILVELDTWAHERARVGLGPRRILGPGLTVDRPEYDLTDESLARVDRAIAAHLAPLRQAVADRVHWAWPPEPDFAVEPWFRQRFESERLFQQLFRKDL